MGLGALGIASQHAFTNQAIQIFNLSDFTFSNLSGKFIHLPCKVPVKHPIFLQLSMKRRANLTPTTLVFAISNESNEPERISSKACTDGQLFITAENNENSKDNQNVKVVGSVSHSEVELSQSNEHMTYQGSLLDKLKAVQLHILASEQWNASRLKLCHRCYSVSATNLIHYLALKCLDVEQLKEDLSSIGLLNLETINPNVLASLTAGIEISENLKSTSLNTEENTSAGIPTKKCLDKKMGEYTINSMRRKASSNRELLLGSLRDQRSTHIMVTVGQEATESDIFVRDLLKTGTTIIRINCAHGNQSIWSEIIRRVKTSSQMLEKPCRILMDLAGPKLRTGKFQSGPCVMKLSPKKNATGNIMFPAQVWLSHKGAGPPPAHLSPDAVIFIDGQEFLSKLQVGDTVRFSDARGKKKMLKIFNKCHVFGGTGFMAECTTTAYVQSGTVLHIKGKKGKFSVGHVVDVPPAEQFVRLRVGDLLIISRDSSAEQDKSNGSMDGAHRVTCHSGYLFDSVKPGDPIAFDDGKIWGVIQGNSMSEIIVSVTHAGPKGTKLGSEKSINIPESNIQFEGLTSKDLMDLEFVAAHADMVGISFVRDTHDIIVLRQELEKRSLHNMGIILKIETKSGFENLPLMLLEAMKSPNPLGVMIARGDLAVECGWERLADMQEEILSICGAAHIPVIWATQVLESLVKSGVPTRAEITDVASGRRASCIMLNKGKHILKAVSILDTVLHDDSTKMKAELKPLLLSSRLSQ